MKRELGILTINLILFVGSIALAGSLASKTTNSLQRKTVMAPTRGGYWGSKWYATCYSNYEMAAKSALQLSAAATAVVEENVYSKDILDRAADLAVASMDLHELLGSCLTMELAYPTVLDEFKSLTNDYNRFMIAAGDVEMGSVKINFETLSAILLEK